MAKTQVPVVCIVASRSGVGKTTFMEKLISHLKARGCRVGTVKHHRGDFDFDVPGKDTWRHAAAGADVVFLSTPSGVGMVKKLEAEISLDALAEAAGDVDIILAEGYKGAKLPKIEIYREAVCFPGELITPPEHLLAVVSDRQLNVQAPCFDLDDARGVAGLLMDTFGIFK